MTRTADTHRICPFSPHMAHNNNGVSMARKKTLGMASLTKKHFVGIADILCAYDASDGMVSAFADYFGRANKQFRRDQFVAHVDRCKRGFDEHGVPYIDKRGRARR